MRKSLLSTVYGNVFSSIYIHVPSEMTLEPSATDYPQICRFCEWICRLHFNHILTISTINEEYCKFISCSRFSYVMSFILLSNFVALVWTFSIASTLQRSVIRAALLTRSAMPKFAFGMHLLTLALHINCMVTKGLYLCIGLVVTIIRQALNNLILITYSCIIVPD